MYAHIWIAKCFNFAFGRCNGVYNPLSNVHVRMHGRADRLPKTNSFGGFEKKKSKLRNKFKISVSPFWKFWREKKQMRQTFFENFFFSRNRLLQKEAENSF
jgi:hypothetical protein